ncbi:Arm DNA-binding domain-containing protein [Methylophaga sp. SB9B]|uniref:Arm DNA-binding domain-containing protein n=1 Tax=Methylophaga sp. SB9B TaxID=2570356 RepID=UPI001FFE3B56|nr:Arm DNA-binding domain-containing protein [Methylophaga sp. SB9B]
MLTDTKIKSLKPKDKLYAVSDEKGLYKEVSTTGGKWWRFKYRFDEKQKRLSVDTYPDVGLKQAREQRDELRKLIANGVDPSNIRKAEKLYNAGQLSFEFVAREWHQKFRHRWSKTHKPYEFSEQFARVV